MNVIKKINTAFSSLVVCLFYIIGIGLAWIIHILTNLAQPKSESFWTPAQKKRLPKQYFSSPY